MRSWSLEGLNSDLRKTLSFSSKCQVNFIPRGATCCVTPTHRIGHKKRVGVEWYRERVSHLLLPVHRCNQPQVARYASRSHTEYRGVVVEGNLHQRVFCLCERSSFQRRRKALPWWCIFHGLLRSQLWGCEKRIKDNIFNGQSAARVISVSRQERAESHKVTPANDFWSLPEENHNHQSLIETCKNELIQLTAAVQRC